MALLHVAPCLAMAFMISEKGESISGETWYVSENADKGETLRRFFILPGGKRERVRK